MTRTATRSTLLLAGVLTAILGLNGCSQDHASSVESIEELLRQGKTHEALESVRAALDHDPTRSDLQFLYGRILIGQRDFNLAIWPLREAARDPDYATRALLIIAETQILIRNGEEALSALEEVLAAEPENRAARSLRARAYLTAMMLNEALADSDYLLEQEPNDLATQMIRLRALLLLERAEEAEAALELLKSDLAEQSDTQPLEMHARVCAAEAVFFRERGERKSWYDKITGCADDYPSQHTVLQEVLKAHGARGESTEALERIEAALAETPEDAEIRFLLAEHHRKAGDVAKGAEILREGTALLGATGPGAWRALYEYYWQAGDFEQALEALEKSIALIREPATADLLLLADTLIEAGELERAEQVSERLGEGYDDLVRARILLERGDLGEAQAALERGIRIWPNNPVARILLGQIAARRGDLEQALNQYIEAYRVDNAQNARITEKTQAAKEIARIQLALGAYEESAEFARAHTVAHASDPEGYELMAEAGARAGKPEFVGPTLQALASLPDGMPRAVALHARLVAEAEGPNAAIRTIKRWKPELTRPENTAVLAILLDQLSTLERHDEAIEVTAKAIESSPDHAPFHVLHARALRRVAGREDEARAALADALAIEPDLGMARLEIAKLEREAGRIEKALAAYDRAIESESDSASLTAALGAARMLATQPGREAEAMRRLERLLEEHPLEARAASALAGLARRPGETRDLDAALEWASRAAQLAGTLGREDASSVFTVLGQVWIDHAEMDNARQALTIAIEANAANTVAVRLFDELPKADLEERS
jgi:tetratricopeptide (TPR) repeat protein